MASEGLLSDSVRSGFETEGVVSMQSEIEIRAQELAMQLVEQREKQRTAAEQTAANGRIFTSFNPTQDIVENQVTLVTSGLFSGNAATMSAAYTGSIQSEASKGYYYDVWNGTDATAESQFSVTYGHRKGSGSSAAGTLNDSPSRAIYSQYRLLLLNPGDTTFH